MAGVLPVYGHVDDGSAGSMAPLPCSAHLVHQAIVANCHVVTIDCGNHAPACLLGDASHGAAVVVVGIGVAERRGYGVR